MLSGALRQLFALSEAYPDLKANPNFQQLQTEISDIENKLAASRRFFNNAVQEYNTGIQQFPAALFAGPFGFRAQQFFDLGESARAARAGAAGEVLRRRAPDRPPRAEDARPSERHGAPTASTRISSRTGGARSLLLIGLFFLVYVMVFAGALVGRGASSGDAPLDWLLRAAWRDFVMAAPFATVGTALWILIAYKFHQSHDRRDHRRPRGDAAGRAAALQSAGKSLHLARHPDAEAAR